MTADVVPFDRAAELLRPEDDHYLRRYRVKALINIGRIPATPPVPPFRRAGEALFSALLEETGRPPSATEIWEFP